MPAVVPSVGVELSYAGQKQFRTCVGSDCYLCPITNYITKQHCIT